MLLGEGTIGLENAAILWLSTRRKKGMHVWLLSIHHNASICHNTHYSRNVLHVHAHLDSLCRNGADMPIVCVHRYTLMNTHILIPKCYQQHWVGELQFTLVLTLVLNIILLRTHYLGNILHVFIHPCILCQVLREQTRIEACKWVLEEFVHDIFLQAVLYMSLLGTALCSEESR